MSNENRAAIWGKIEARHFGPCVWQVRSPNGRSMFEALLHKRTGLKVVVEKTYASSLPETDSDRDWPALASVDVYVPIDAENMTWDALDAALTTWNPASPLARQ